MKSEASRQAHSGTYRQNLLVTLFCVLPVVFHSSAASSADSLPVIQLHAQVRLASMADADDSHTRMIDSESTRLVTALLEHAGLEFEYNLSPWTRIFQLLETRENILTYPVARLPSREDTVYWVGMMRPIKLSLYGLTENKDRLPTTLEEARNFQIGVLRDDAIDRYLVHQGFDNLVRFSDLENSLDMLRRARFDLFPFDAVGIARILQQNHLPADLLTPAVALDEISTESFFVLSLATDETIKQRLRDSYNELIKNGTFEAIMGFPHESHFGLE